MVPTQAISLPTPLALGQGESACRPFHECSRGAWSQSLQIHYRSSLYAHYPFSFLRTSVKSLQNQVIHYQDLHYLDRPVNKIHAQCSILPDLRVIGAYSALTARLGAAPRTAAAHGPYSGPYGLRKRRLALTGIDPVIRDLGRALDLWLTRWTGTTS
jgi:hypothetical protein